MEGWWGPGGQREKENQSGALTAKDGRNRGAKKL